MHAGGLAMCPPAVGGGPCQTATIATERVFWRVMDTDVALAAHLARDLDAAFPVLVASQADRLFTIAVRLLGDPRDAEEVAQDTLVRAYRAMASYPPERVADLRLRPWLASITVNLVRNRRRNLADRFPPQTLDAMIDAGYDPADGRAPEPAAVAEQRARARELGELLLRLPPHLRAAVVLRHVSGLSVAETAAALGRPEGTVKAQVSRGLDRLRQLLAEGEAAATAGAATGPPRPAPTATTHSIPTVLKRRVTAAAEVLP
jgi:RNA polymerase sigma factor (sigma-70 family)